MLPTLTYLQFHLVFSLPVLAALWYLAPRYGAVRQRRATAGIAILVAIAYVYTTPWISYMIRRGAWGYADGAVLVRALSIPLGEYLFFAIQTVVTAFALHLIGFDPTFREGDFDWRPRIAGVVGGGVLWEAAEYAIHALSDRLGVEALLVHYGLRDTLFDLLFNLVGAALVLLFGDRLLGNLIDQLRGDSAL